MKRCVLMALAMVLANPALGQESATFYDGFWGVGDLPECIDDSGGFSTCPAISIFQGVLSGFESTCAMKFHSDVPAFESMLIYDLDCRGEGETWTSRALFMLDLDGRLNILDDQGARIYLPDRSARGGGTGTVTGD